MFGFGDKLKSDKISDSQSQASNSDETSLFNRLKQGLSKTRSKLSDGLDLLVLSEKIIDSTLLEDVETQLLSADVGIDATNQIISSLETKLDRRQFSDPEKFMAALKDELALILQPCEAPLEIGGAAKPFVILTIGINGVGKTTTIGKLTKKLQKQGLQVMLAAGDTFRAAAVEQLQIWGERNNVQVIAQENGADSASVIFDAYQSAKAKQVDVLIADTAGRLHTKDNLMNELGKIIRVLKKQDERLPHEVLLVLDATTGQNALSQAESFHTATKVSGIALTKIDGTAKGGMVFALAKTLGLPIRYIGVGEQIDDLRTFDAKQFISALFQK